MDATCTIQDSIHVFNLVHKYVSRILGTYQKKEASWIGEKAEKQNICSNGKKEEASWIGGKR